MKRYSFLNPAILELEESAHHYGEISYELSLGLRDDMDRALSFLLEFPHAAKRVDAIHRSFKLRRFPYSIIYRISAEELVIVAVAHTLRRPGYWRSRGAKL
jgi:toxin ParE1/3/4